MSSASNTIYSNIVWWVPLVFLLLGAIRTVKCLYWLSESRQSRNWPTVTGTIVMSRLITETPVYVTEIRALLTTTMYGAKIRYSYTVDGRSLEGGRIGWTGGRLARTDHDARKRMAKYPVGKQVAVYYQPDKPENAVLETAVNGLATGDLLVAAFWFFGAGLWAYLMGM